MRLCPIPQGAAGLAALALVASLPYAIPVPWAALNAAFPGRHIQFFDSPVLNQTWYLVFGAGAIGLLLIGAATSINRRLLVWAALPLLVLTWPILQAAIIPWTTAESHRLLLQGSLAIIFFAAAFFPVSAQQLRRRLFILIVLSAPLAAIALLQAAGVDLLPYSSVLPGTSEVITGKLLVSSTFGHPNYMASYLAPLIPVSLLASSIVWRSRKSAALTALCVSAFLLLAVILAGTRGPFLAATTGIMVAWLIAFPKSSKRSALPLIVATILIIVIGILILAGAGVGESNVFARLTASKEIATRLFYWNVALFQWRNHPWLGEGLGSFNQQFWKSIASMPSAAPGGEWHFALNHLVRGVAPGNLHNDHLQYLVEQGLLGYLLWATMWIAIMCRTFVIPNPFPPEWAALQKALATALLVFALDAVFFFPTHLPCCGALFAYLLGLWVNVTSKSDLSQDQPVNALQSPPAHRQDLCLYHE